MQQQYSSLFVFINYTTRIYYLFTYQCALFFFKTAEVEICMCIIKRLHFCIVKCFICLYLFVIIAHTLTTIYKYFYMSIYINPLSHSNYVSRYQNIMNCILQNDCLLHNIIDLLRRGINRSKDVNIIQLTNVTICYCHHDGIIYLDTHQRSAYIHIRFSTNYSFGTK